MLKTLLNSWKRKETDADARWRKRVSIRVVNGKLNDAKAWLRTDNGQLMLIGLFVALMGLAGALEKVLR